MYFMSYIQKYILGMVHRLHPAPWHKALPPYLYFPIRIMLPPVALGPFWVKVACFCFLFFFRKTSIFLKPDITRGWWIEGGQQHFPNSLLLPANVPPTCQLLGHFGIREKGHSNVPSESPGPVPANLPFRTSAAARKAKPWTASPRTAPSLEPRGCHMPQPQSSSSSRSLTCHTCSASISTMTVLSVSPH